MESFTVNICQKKEGSVWQSKTRIGGVAPLLCIVSDPPDHLYAKYRQCSRIIHAVIEGTTNRVLTGDRNGYVYIFDLENNNFWLLFKLGSCCSALAFTPLRERDVLVGTSDCKLHLFESASRKRVAFLVGHDSCISRISVDAEGKKILTCSLTAALLWDLLTLRILQKLAIPGDSSITDTFFIASGDAIVLVTDGNEVTLWDTAALDAVASYKIPTDDNKVIIRTIDSSIDGKYLAASARTNWVILWEVVNPDKPRVMTVSRHITSVRQIAFLCVKDLTMFKYNHLLLVLNHSGSLHMYCVETGEHILDIKLDDDRILSVHSAGTGGRFVACTCSGRVHVYDFGDIYLASDRRYPTKKATLDHNASDRNFVHDVDRLSDVTLEHLRGIVKEFGAYPEKYRFLIWRNLLSIPNNSSAYKVLSSRGIHPSYENVETKYPIANKTVLRALQRVLSNLAYWCPKLTEVDYLPTLVFPFVKLFHTNLHQCVEIIISFLCIWGQNWFSYFPNVPYSILAAVENILASHAKSLLLHFVRHGITAQIYAWPLLQCLYSEVVSRSDWLQLVDHVFSNSPAFLLYAVASFNIILQRELKKCEAFADFEEFYHHQHSSLSVREVIKTAYCLQSTSDRVLRDSVSQAIGPFVSLPSGSDYPSFNNFPKLAIDWQGENRQLQEEIEYFKKRQEILLRDTKTVTKNPCTCNDNRNDLPQLRRVQDDISTKGPDHLAEERSAVTKQTVAGRSLFCTGTDGCCLRGKNVINKSHTDVVKYVLQTRKMICRNTTSPKQLTSAAHWTYDML